MKYTTPVARRAFAAAIAMALIGCAPPDAADRLNDQKDILSPTAESRVGAFQRSMLSEFDIDLAIDVPLASPADPARYAHDLMERRRVGAATAAARGVLLLVDVDARIVRMEVGPDLEHVFPDAFVSRVERDQMAPFFREGRVGDGVEATVELLVVRVSEAIAQGDYSAESERQRNDFSAGAGATEQAPIGVNGSRATAPDIGQRYGAQASPAAVLTTYLEILGRREAASDLDLYTPETRALLASRLVTRAQQNNESRRLESVIKSARFVRSDSHAVALFDESRDVPPYFFRRGPGGWRLDLATSANSIRFDLQNRWFFIESTGAYSFAFE